MTVAEAHDLAKTTGKPYGEGESARAGGPRLAYVPGFDGLRALAVIAVLLYHAELPWMGGGFLGVEIFFALSGYLITSLLLAEWRQSGRIDLRAFWLRRARRLLPALFLLLAVTLTFAVLFLPDEVMRLRGDALAAMGYVTNWYLVFSQQSYFEAMSRPSLLQHLWSLAVEEQFYLVWPLVLAFALRVLRTRVGLLILLMLGAAASAGLMAILYQPGADTSRIYYGTDTRAAGLLIGSALAAAWPHLQRPLSSARSWLTRFLPDIMGVIALCGLTLIVVLLDETQTFLYQGGFALTAILTAMVITVSAHPRASVIPQLLEWRALRWVGLRSYGIYLWHWPVFSFTRPELDVPLDGAFLLALRLAITLLLAEASYRYVEVPVRSGSLGRSWRLMRASPGRGNRRLAARWAGAALSGGLFALVLGAALVQAKPPSIPDYLSASDVNTTASQGLPLEIISGAEPSDLDWTEAVTPAPPLALSQLSASIATPTYIVAAAPLEVFTPTLQPASATQPPPTRGNATATITVSPAPDTPTPVPPPQATEIPVTQIPTMVPTPTPVPPTRQPSSFVYGSPPAHVDRITAIGDSVMIGAASELRRVFGNIDVDAAKNRQVAAGINTLRARVDAGQVGDVVIIHLGMNGYFTAKQLDQLMQIAGSERTVIFLNDKVPRRWEGPNNAVLADGVKRYPNAVLIDWRGAIAGRPGLLAKDGIHIGAAGARFYVQLIAISLGK